EAGDVQPFAYLQLVFASAIGVLIFGEALELWTVIGASLTIAAGLYTLWRAQVRSRQQAR
ncbi:MAG: EamA/RhaT family transporter, partial [Pseudomonadota bacterium]